MGTRLNIDTGCTVSLDCNKLVPNRVDMESMSADY